VVKRANTRKRVERQHNFSKIRWHIHYATGSSPTEPNATGGAGKQVDGSPPENLAASDIWPLDGQDGSGGVIAIMVRIIELGLNSPGSGSH